jgi:hypothetical protein
LIELEMVSHSAGNGADFEVSTITGVKTFTDIKSKVGYLDHGLELTLGAPLTLVVSTGARVDTSSSFAKLSVDSSGFRWELAFEDGSDADFNDFVLRLTLR